MNDKKDMSASTVKGLLVFVWLWVSLPLAYGLVQLLRQVGPLFGG